MPASLKYFGTDGIRGKYGGVTINEKFSYSLGIAFAHFLETRKHDKAKPVLLAQDTRLSGGSLIAHCMEGLKVRDFNPINLGVIPTPVLAFSILDQEALGGIMVTASHNPHYDNGLKIISSEGGKLTIEEELSIESYISAHDHFSRVKELSTIDNSRCKTAYIKNLRNWFEPDFLNGMKIVIDLANGATKEISPLVLESFGAQVISMNKGEGLINEQVGSEFTKGLSEKVIQEKADIGLAHDGDGDRIVFIDRNGNKINGDQILGILALHNNAKDNHKPNGMVATIHSNSGLEQTLKRKAVKFYRSDVGDRNVFALMQQKGINWGGESSGHIICSNYLNTGDGLFSALSILSCIRNSNSEITTLANEVKLWPYASTAIHTHSKKPISSIANLQLYLEEIEKCHGEQVRVLIRYSGTEPKIRILVEAENTQIMKDVFHQVKVLVSQDL